MVLLCWVVACGGDVSQSSADVVLEVDFDHRTHRVGRIVGWNIGAGSRYSPLGGERHPEWRTEQTTEALRRLSEIRPPNGDRPVVRFSGLQIDGAVGQDGYHFYDFADPQSEPSPTDNVAPFEYMAIIDEIDGDPLVTLNFGSGTAREAANYARHLVGTDPIDPFVVARAFWGRVEPWPVDIYEIGNEVFLVFNTGYSDAGAFSYANPEADNGGDPSWYGQPSSLPQAYADRASEYIDAVLAVQPSARFYVPLTQSSWASWGGPAQSLPVLRDLLERPEVAGVVIHQYIIDDGQAGHGWEPAEDPWFVSSSDFYRPLYIELRAMLDSLQRAEPLEIAVTEYLSAALDTRGRLFAGDLAIADMLMLYADVGVDLALEHLTLAEDPSTDTIVRDWHKPFYVDDDGDVMNRPAIAITKLFADHLWHHAVSITEVKMPTARQELRGDGYDYNIVSTMAFVSDDSSSASIVMLNRDLARPRSVEIALGPGDTVNGARAVVPDDLWTETLETNVETSELAFDQEGNRVHLTLPPHSFAALALSRTAE